MADLSITAADGSQTSTQNPQGLVGSDASTAASSTVQPGAADLQPATATNSTGIALHPSQLAIVNVDTGVQPTVNSSPAIATVVQAKHHINGGLLGISIGLFVVAAAVFVMITRSAKNTTNRY